MQANEVTLNVDYLNDGTTTPEAFERAEEYLNRSVYVSSAHTLESRDMFTLYRSPASKSGNFKGVGKTAAKFTKDFSVTGVDGVATLTSPVIIEISFSIPVGVSAADVLKCRQRALALLDSDTEMDKLNVQQLV